MMFPSQGPAGSFTSIIYDYYVNITIVNNGTNPVTFNKMASAFDGGDINSGYGGVSYSKDGKGWTIAPGGSISFDFQTIGNQAEELDLLARAYKSKIRFSIIFLYDDAVIGDVAYYAYMPFAKELPIFSSDASKGYPLSFDIKTK